ncbi:Coenzyme F420 hydrogenase/dehydrogenase, beta subunit C-terminal domain [Paraprevotella clara]
MPTLASKEKCTGCAACYNACAHSAITMVEDAEGFLVPKVDSSKCVECKLCEMSCPVTIPLKIWGMPTPKTFALISERDRRGSSSGGAFSAFARIMLENGGVVYGAAFDKKLHCHHIEIQNIKDLSSLRGSKYVQSEVGDVFKRVKTNLISGRKVLFCGTPCQVAGLKNFLRKPYTNLLTLDLICHGVPSDMIYQSYLKKISSRFAAFPDGYEFRNRNGWGKAPSISVCGKFRRIYGVDALFMEAFNASAIFRKCCYSCPYSGLPRVGDCTLGDFWGIGRYGKPFKYDTMKGVSLVLANTEVGEAAMRLLKDCYIEERTLEEALIENHNLNEPSKLPSNRDNIIRDFLNPKMTLKVIDTKYNLVDHSLKATVKNVASRLGLFSIVKRVYNWYKVNSYGKA